MLAPDLLPPHAINCSVSKADVSKPANCGWLLSCHESFRLYLSYKPQCLSQQKKKWKRTNSIILHAAVQCIFTNEPAVYYSHGVLCPVSGFWSTYGRACLSPRLNLFTLVCCYYNAIRVKSSVEPPPALRGSHRQNLFPLVGRVQ